MDTFNKQHIKGYDLRERIGAGGFGAVYRAHQSTVGREVAIKIILPGLANQPDFIRRFESEAQLIARLEHPHITPLYDYWRDPEGAYLVMRWLRGGSLRDALQNGAFELRAAALVLDQIAGALSLAHRNGVIHRDIKPANILLDEDGNAYLTDFGIAKDLNIQNSHTQQDAIVGSLDYISPEQARSEPVTARTDIYSLGVTLFELITGHHPFENMSSVERLYKHINDPLPDITTVELSLQDEINRVIQKATAKNPEQRYPDALAFAADFREAVGMNRTSTTMEELLTQREHEILHLIIDGLSNKEIAQKLTVTLGTVKWYVNQIYNKLGVRSRVQAIVRARELHLIVKSDEKIEAVMIPTEDFHPENPYKGLRAFQAADNQDFFGREKITAKLIKRLGESGESGRFLAVVGPSGSGKSSLVKAGLIPAVWRGELPGSEKWFVVEMLPGSRPLDELEIALTKIAANQAGNLHEHLSRDAFGLARVASLILPNDNSELVIVIDQFEEVFTLLDDENSRQHFLDLLHAAVTEPRSRIRIVMTLRADFYDRPLHYPQFGELVRTHLETIMPLSAEELERAIAKPAEQVGVTFEPGLVSAIIGDVNYQPGALPLLQYALTELFEQRKGRLLTREAYQQIGGTIGALAKRAEEVFLNLDADAQAITRQIFLRLVTLGEGTEDTRRRTARSELQALATDGDILEDVIDTFASYRLFSLDTDPGTRTPTVEVAHEALLREWERLRSWLNESRDEIKIQRQLSVMADEWHKAKQDSSFLARGSRLDQFETWAAHTQLSLTAREKAYLEKSIVQRDLDAQAEKERQAREKQLEKRSQNFLRGLVAVFAVALVIAIGLSTIAFRESDRANDALIAEQAALSAEQAARATSEANFNRAEQQRLYLQADNAMDNGATGNVGLALAIRSLEYGYTAGADATLMRASRQGVVRHILTGHQFEINGLNYSPDGKLIATCTEGGTRIYDALTGQELRLLAEETIVRSVVFSRDSATLLTTGIDGNIRLWDVTSGSIIRTYTNGTTPRYAWFTPDGSQMISWMPDHFQVWDLASGNPLERYPFAIDNSHTLLFVPHNSSGDLLFAIEDADNRVYLEDARTGEVICTLLEANTAKMQNHWWTSKYETPHRLSFIVTDDYIVHAWDTTTCTPLAEFAGHTSYVHNADYDLNRGMVVTLDDVGTAIHWSIHTGNEVGRYIANNGGYALDISPDGKSLIMSDWNEVAVWDMAFPQQPQRFVTNQYDHTHFPRFSPDGTSLYIGGFGEYSRWQFDGAGVSHLITYKQPIRVIAISPDEQYLFAPLENDGSVAYLIDATTGETVQEFRGHEAVINFTDYSNDGTRVVTGSFDLTARVWDVATGEPLQIFEGHTGVVASASFSPDATMILTTSSDNTARIWDTQTGEEIRSLNNRAPVPYGIFSPDGKLVATADTNGFGHVWDVATGAELHTLVGHTDTLWSIRFSIDGTLLVTASWDGTARIWEVATGRLVRVLDAGDTKQLYWAEFSPDGEYIVTGSAQNDAVNLWRVELDDVIADYCAQNPLDLTKRQRTQYGILDERDVCAEQS